ncbi:HNH endonuclease [Vibrio sp. 1-Bac 57]
MRQAFKTVSKSKLRNYGNDDFFYLSDEKFKRLSKALNKEEKSFAFNLRKRDKKGNPLLSDSDREAFNRILIKLRNAIHGTYFKEVLKAAKYYTDCGKGKYSQEVDRLMHLAMIKYSMGNWFPSEQQIQNYEVFDDLPYSEPSKSELKTPKLTKYELKKIKFILYAAYLISIVHRISVKDNDSKTPFKLIRFDFDSFDLQLGYTAFNENYTSFGMDLREILLSAQGDSIEHFSDKWNFGQAFDIAEGRSFDDTCKICNLGYVVRDIFTGFTNCKTCERRKIFSEMGITLNDDVNADKADVLLKATCSFCGCDIHNALTFTKRKQKRFICDCRKPQKKKAVKQITKVKPVTKNKPNQTTTSVTSDGRIGQDYFKSEVTKVCNGCCVVTGVQDQTPSILIGSHIKSWADSSDEERMDGHNGLLLAPHIDKLYDKHLITFSKSGKILVSKLLNESVLIVWGIDIEKQYSLTDIQHEYMKWHREIFKKKQENI